MAELSFTFTGPYSWPKHEEENSLPSLPTHSGLYLQTAEYQKGYLIHLAGLTRRPLAVRFREHTHKYFRGEYTILDPKAMTQGKRLEIWHGWGWTSEKRELFEIGQQPIRAAVDKQLQESRIFVADITSEGRILERLEASIMKGLYNQTSPICDIPDRGMQLSSRWQYELPIAVKISASEKIYGLPVELEI